MLGRVRVGESVANREERRKKDAFKCEYAKPLSNGF